MGQSMQHDDWLGSFKVESGLTRLTRVTDQNRSIHLDPFLFELTFD